MFGLSFGGEGGGGRVNHRQFFWLLVVCFVLSYCLHFVIEKASLCLSIVSKTRPVGL